MRVWELAPKYKTMQYGLCGSISHTNGHLALSSGV